MIRYIALVHCAIILLGCSDDYKHPAPHTCAVSYDCVVDDQCAVPQCVDKSCSYTNAIDGLSCETIDGYNGVCDTGTCIGISNAPLLTHIPSNKCNEHSDCFVQQCTNSICNYGHCVHVAYENNRTCFGTKDGEIYTGVCVDGTCK